MGVNMSDTGQDTYRKRIERIYEQISKNLCEKAGVKDEKELFATLESYFSEAIDRKRIYDAADKAVEWIKNVSDDDLIRALNELGGDYKNRVTEPLVSEDDLVYRLRKRAEIRRQIKTRKSVQEGKPDRISDLLEEAANEIEYLRQLEE